MTILIVDDREFVRQSIRRLLSTRTDVLVCGEAEDGIRAVEKAKSLRPDIIFMDVSMPGMDGAQAAKIIRREVPESRSLLSVTMTVPLSSSRGRGRRLYRRKRSCGRTDSDLRQINSPLEGRMAG